MPMNITIREQPLPGVGKRYEIDLSETRRLHVVAATDGGRWLGVAEAHDEDPPIIELDREQATMIGALLLGARFSIDISADPEVSGDTAIVETVTIPEDAPSVGHRPSEVLGAAPQSAQVLGIIRHQTPELIEPDLDAPLRSGDEVAIAARFDQMAGTRELLTGRST